MDEKGEVVVTLNEQGECVLVSRQNEEHEILSIIWEKPGATESTIPTPPEGEPNLDEHPTDVSSMTRREYLESQGKTIDAPRTPEKAESYPLDSEGRCLKCGGTGRIGVDSTREPCPACTSMAPEQTKPELLTGHGDQRPKRGGWAPGFYSNTCQSCGRSFVGDKRAWTCADCAYADTGSDQTGDALAALEALADVAWNNVESHENRYVIHHSYDLVRQALTASGVPEEVRRLPEQWRQEAREQIPEEYTVRGLENKYLAGDNQAAGLDDAAEELEFVLNGGRD